MKRGREIAGLQYAFLERTNGYAITAVRCKTAKGLKNLV